MAEGAYGKMGIARFYALVFGIAYLAVAILELFYSDKALSIGNTVILYKGTLHNVIHFAVGILVIGSFFAGESAAKSVARVVGVLFLVITIWNVVAGDSYADFVGIPGGELPVSYTIVHAITAIGALFAGFSAGRGYRSTAAA